jgi:hypothetical protein
MRISSARRLASRPRALVILLLTVALRHAGTASAHDANADFVPNSPNPNGVWQYGYTTSLGSGLIPFNEYISNSNAYGWRTNISSGAPVFAHFDTSFAGVLAGETALHGGPNGEFAVLRFTTPSTGVYDISATWRGPGDVGNTDLYLLKNSNSGSPLDSTASTTISGMFQLNNVLLLAGDTIDLALGIGGDNFFSDSTPVNLQINLVPEPASAILAAALLALATLLRRR